MHRMMSVQYGNSVMSQRIGARATGEQLEREVQKRSHKC
jgi:hypothetical protein